MYVRVESVPQKLTKDETLKTYEGYSVIFGWIDGEYSALVSQRADLSGISGVIRREKQGWNKFMKNSCYGAKPMVYSSHSNESYAFRRMSSKSVTGNHTFQIYRLV